jgi:ribosome-interacting GTPase 1
MPANLTPQYFEAEQKYREAKTPQEKLHALKLMHAIIPKHKGTEKLQADIKRKISRLTDDMEQSRKAGKRHSDFVKKEGAGQVVLVGPPNSGKSSIVNVLTHAEPEVADYPFTTHKPAPAMMPFKDIQVQMVDMPPITETCYEGWWSNIIRDCDLVLVVIGLDEIDPDGAAKVLLKHLDEAGIILASEAGADDDDLEFRAVKKKTRLVLNKKELGGVDIMRALLKPVVGDIPVIAISCSTGEGIEELRASIVDWLALIRVYTKVPGKKADMSKPYVVKKGTTILQIAGTVHKDFKENLKFARVWGHTKFEGQPVEKTYELEDGDIIELHI